MPIDKRLADALRKKFRDLEDEDTSDIVRDIHTPEAYAEQDSANQHPMAEMAKGRSMLRPNTPDLTGSTEGDMSESPELRNARLEEAAMPKDQTMVPPPQQSFNTRTKSPEELEQGLAIAADTPNPRHPQASLFKGRMDLGTMDVSQEPAAMQVPPPMNLGIMSTAPTQAPKPKGIGLSLTSDRHATLSEVPQSTSDQPQDQVDNHQLSNAVNALSATSSTGDVQKAMQREHAPRDRSGYFAALKQIAQGSARMASIDDPNAGSYYDTKIAQEQAAQGDWRKKTAEAMKQKFEGEQNAMGRGLKEKELGAHTETNRLKAEELKGWHAVQDANRDTQTAETERHNRATEGNAAQRINIHVGGVDDRMYERMVQDVGKKLPPGGEVKTMNNILAELDTGMAPGTGYFMNKDGFQSFIRSPEGSAFRQKVLSIVNEHIKRVHGANVPPGEEERAMGRYGYGSFNNAQDLDSGMRLIAQEMQANIDQTMARQHPEVRSRLESREGAVPKIGGQYGAPIRRGRPVQGQLPNIQDHGVEAAIEQSRKNASEAPQWMQKVNSWLGEKLGTKAEAVQNAKDMEDEEARKRARKDAGIQY